MSQTPEPPFEGRQQGISLAELAAAYAQAMGRGPQAGESADRPAEPPVPAAEGDLAHRPQAELQDRVEASAGTLPAENAAAQAPAADRAEEDACPVSPLTILEAMLFVGDRVGQPLSAARAAELMRGVEPDEIPDLVEQLNRRYAGNGCPYHVVSDSGGYLMALRPEFYPLREQFYGKIREARLSQAAIDVLAIVAYKQPLTADRVSRLRGRPCGHVLAQLVHRGLLRIDRAASPRRVAHYQTTDRFLALFGLESLGDLPRSAEP